MKLTKRIKKHIGRAAVLLSLITAVQSTVVPYDLVYADEAAEAAEEAAAEDDEYMINPPKFGVYDMKMYKAMTSVPKEHTKVLLVYSDLPGPCIGGDSYGAYAGYGETMDYVLPINYMTASGMDGIGFCTYDPHIKYAYASMVGIDPWDQDDEYDRFRSIKPKYYRFHHAVRLTPYDASLFDISTDLDSFYISDKNNKILNPGEIWQGTYGTYLGAVDEDGKTARYGKPYCLQLPMNDYREDNGILTISAGLFNDSTDRYWLSGDELSVWPVDRQKSPGWYYILDTYGAHPTFNEPLNCFMVHRDSGVWGCLLEDLGSYSAPPKDEKFRQFKIFIECSNKYTSIPDYTVTQTFEIKAGEYGTADGGTDKTKGIIIPPGTTLKIEKGAVMTVAGNLINDGTIENEGTIIIQKGGSISSFRAGSEPSKNGCGAIKCNGGDILILEGGALYAGMADENGASVPFNLDSGSTLVNKGLLVYGKMDLGQSARVELRKGSKTYGSWINAKAVKKTVTHEISVTTDDAVQLYENAYRNYRAIPSYESLLDQYKVTLLRSKFSAISAPYSELGYRSNGMSDADLQRLEPTDTSYYTRRYKFQLDWFYEKPIVQTNTFDTCNSAFLSGKTSGITLLSTVGSEAYGIYKETLGICVNSNAEGKYAPHIKIADGAYFNDPLKDETVTVEELTL